MDQQESFAVIKQAARRYKQSEKTDADMSRLLHTQHALEMGDIAEAKRFQELPDGVFFDAFFSQELKGKFDSLIAREII